MILDGLSLAVEGIVLGTCEFGLSARETALDCAVDNGGADGAQHGSL